MRARALRASPAPARLGAAGVRDVARSPSRTGCGRRRRSSRRSGSHDASVDRAVVVRSRPTRGASTSRSIPGSRSAPATHPTTRLCLEWLARSSAPAARCSTTAAARGFSRSPRRSSAPARASASTSTRRPSTRARAQRGGATLSRRRFTLPDALDAAARHVRRRRRQHPRQSTDAARARARGARARGRPHRAVRASSPPGSRGRRRVRAVVYHRRLEAGDDGWVALGRKCARSPVPTAPANRPRRLKIIASDGRRKIHPLPRLQDCFPRDAAAACDARRDRCVAVTARRCSTANAAN